jgi:ferredoxin-NADP reductase/predicted pyridoxine 5'-phosphate oxidase superfamily flavin-nucleotide-binding protein
VCFKRTKKKNEISEFENFALFWFLSENKRVNKKWWNLNCDLFEFESRISNFEFQSKSPIPFFRLFDSKHTKLKANSDLMHSGELFLHQALGVPPELSARMPTWPDTAMDADRQLFFTNLPYLGLGTLDAAGRPWATCFVGTIECEPNRMRLRPRFASDADPVLAALATVADRQVRPWAGVGVDFSNRRRNKVEGVAAVAAGNNTLDLVVQATMGNCPKYIQLRTLVPHTPTPVVERARGALTPDAKALVHRCDTLFITSVHKATLSMDTNHRGGPAGFCRVTESGAQIVLPDFSGNRIFSSLGNIVSDGVAGLAFLDFVSGDMLHVTGSAKILLGAESQAVMPRANVIVVVDVDEFVLVRGGFPLRQVGPVGKSPYNPLVRKLRSEADDALAKDRSSELIFAGAECLTPTVTTFRFRAPGLRALPRPGQYATVDCASLRASPPVYMHMNQARPQSLSDDFVRTWTISNAVSPSAEPLLEFTVKRKSGGAVSPLLHANQNSLAGLRLLGFGGDFDAIAPGANVWIAAGSGVTPFMAALPSLSSSNSDVTMVLVVRQADAALATPFQRSPHVKLSLFVTDGPTGRPTSFPVALGATYWICGPQPFMELVRESLVAAGVSPSALRSETFDF